MVVERVTEMTFDRAPVRERGVRPARRVVRVLYHDHVAAEDAARRAARQQPRPREVALALRVDGPAVDEELRILGCTRVDLMPMEVRVRQVLAVVDVDLVSRLHTLESFPGARATEERLADDPGAEQPSATRRAGHES